MVDSTKLRAAASPEAVLTAEEYAPVRAEIQRILAEAEVVDAQEEREGRPGETRLGKTVAREQMRGLVRRVRKQLARQKAAAPSASAGSGRAARSTWRAPTPKHATTAAGRC